ncbi:AraC-like DNA-binding protein [Aquimarina sp. EL_43]|uniref:helix-turn-helix domain-containing protein n=1 Tax=unclassified Aquimarina TaxID=2627091 RepID=UPI0018CBE830|nr:MULTISPECIES: helix-turn-helix domain-containing protein [unclassified Aquimarina]MBG6129115.1 AraC-like DNA-binding protein [Aquimarina sp. EL_35]MBG6150180.1 AraC-like DNA-binding protein [Aquimarina sp. EL_32]MBG6167135.1 AraC-like DNA-binding protein [Aquimarina sp. EL_43]
MTTHYKPLLGKYLILPSFILVFNPFCISAQENDSQDAIAYIKQAGLLYDNEDYEKSMFYYDKAEQIAKKSHHDSLLSIIYARKGHIHLRDGKNKDALDAYSKALDITELTGHKEIEIKANSGLIVILKRMNRLDKALKTARRSLKLIPNTNLYKKGAHASILILTSEVYLDKEQYDSTLYYIEKGLDISKELGYKEAILDLYIKKGMVYYYQKKYDTSLDFLFKAKNILSQQEINNKTYPVINTNYFIASCYYQQKFYDKAINVLTNSINNFSENDSLKPPAIRSHLLLAHCYNEKKEHKKANLWSNKYVKLNESYQKDKDQTVDIIHEKETNRLQKEIVTLKASQTKDKQAKNLIFWILLITLTTLACIVFMYIKKQRSNKTLFNKLMKEINDLEFIKQTTINKKESSKEIIIGDQKINEIIKGLEKLEIQEYFLKSECNLRSMAKKLKTNATYLSKIINIHKEKNFTDYINDLRIEYVLKRLKDDKKFRSFSIQSIASEIGYKSSYSLVKHFKAKTGINPSYYIKSLDKQHLDSKISI